MNRSLPNAQSIAIAIPCLNEERTIAQLVRNFRRELPHAAIYVYDNNSTDETADRARDAGAHIRTVEAPGKGAVVRQILLDMDTDALVISDGDSTYDAADVHKLFAVFNAHDLDMIIGARHIVHGQQAYPTFHALGNRLFSKGLRLLFGGQLSDPLSGYRILSRRFARTFPARAQGFEVEIEMGIFSIQTGMNVREVDIVYYERPAGSKSKLSTYRDGCKILAFMMKAYILTCSRPPRSAPQPRHMSDRTNSR